MGKKWKQWQNISWAPNHCEWWFQPWNSKMLVPWKKSYDKPRQHIEKQRHHFVNKGLYSQSYDVSSCHVWMWQLDIQNTECWRIDAFEWWCWRRHLRVAWTAKRSNQSILKINPEYSLEGLLLKLKLQYFGHLMWRAFLLEKDPEAGKDWGQEGKGASEDEMIGWHHQLSGHEFVQSPGGGEGQGCLVCCGPWGHKESYTNEWLNNNNPSLGVCHISLNYFSSRKLQLLPGMGNGDLWPTTYWRK